MGSGSRAILKRFIAAGRPALFPVLVGALAASACASPARQPPMGVRGDAPGILASDADGDGMVTRAEFVAARQARFSQLDRDGDGYLSRSDASAGGPGLRGRALRRGGGGEAMQALLRMDRDGDGRISRTEFLSGPSAMFDRADGDGDGRLSRHEVEGLRTQAAGARGG